MESLDELLEGGGLEVVGSWDWVVLRKKAHDTHGEVGHIFADHKGKVAGVDLLVMDDVVANLVTSPSGVGKVSQGIDVSSVDSHGHPGNVWEWEKVGSPLLVPVKEVLVVVGVDLEAVLPQVLGVVEDGLDRSPVRFVTHVDCESVVVV